MPRVSKTTKRRSAGIGIIVALLWLLFVLFDFAVVVGIGFVILHFVRKWW